MPNCPICHSNTKQFCNLDTYSYFQCNHCKTLFLYPTPSLTTMRTYYSDNFMYSAAIPQENQIRERAKLILINLKKLNPTGKTLLDIGSGYGFFLDEVRKLTNIIGEGIEPSKKLFSLSKHKNLSVMNITLEKFKTNEKYDFITLIHVIEHINDPIALLKKASMLLNKNGILFVETPNIDSHLFNVEKNHYTFLTPPDHIYLFSSTSFTYMLQNTPYLLIKKRGTYSDTSHFIGIIRQIARKKHYPRKITVNSINNHRVQINKRTKIKIIDDVIGPLFTPLLNISNKGSILELYIKKK